MKSFLIIAAFLAFSATLTSADNRQSMIQSKVMLYR